MTQEQAVERLQILLAHAWMVRQFLKHAEEVQEDVEILDVHRTIFDYIRAVEPAFLRSDWKEYLHRAKGKLPKLRKASEILTQEYRRISDHTNYQMAAESLRGVVLQIEEVFASLQSTMIS